MTNAASIVSALGLFVGFGTGAVGQEGVGVEERFPASGALAEGVSPETLGKLSELIEEFVEEGEIVGAELMVVKGGKTILHEAFGWSDLGAEVPMEVGRVFCVRSMTKPVVGAAIWMLIEDGTLELEDRVAEYLPAFDVDGTREITVEQLLTHTSGLPMSLILAKDLGEIDGIQAVAELGGGCKLEFEPGDGFNYSDQGTDTLTALIEIVTEMPAREFVETRVLEPLGMDESACVLGEEHVLRERAIAKYTGSRGAWQRFWSPTDPPLFPFFLGSQGLYSTLEDYARFMDFWQSKGRVNRERVLSSRSVRKVLTPGPHSMNMATGFPGLRGEYGSLMQLWTDAEGEVVVYGHGGSDGTHAWVFPEQKAMVFYFTQSRNNASGLRVEEVLGELFLGVPYDPNQAAPPFEEFLGYYREHEDDLYRAIIRDGEDLALEIMGKGIVPLTYIGEDRWKFRPNPSVVLEFDRGEDGVVSGYKIGDHQEFRFQPAAELPSADELAARVAQAHRLDLLETIGPFRARGALINEAQSMQGETLALLAWPDRFRFDFTVNDNFEHTAFDGEKIRYSSSARPDAEVLEGELAAAARLSNSLARFGDWHRWHPKLQVIQQLHKGTRDVILVRTGDTSAPARTLYVDVETGFVVREESVGHIEGLGRIGRRFSFGDFHEISGMQLPHRTEIEYANPLIGTIVLTVDDVEVGVELPEGVFELRE